MTKLPNIMMALAAAALLFDGSAYAQDLSPTVGKFNDGTNTGRYRIKNGEIQGTDQVFPGAEQGTVVQTTANGGKRLLNIVMSSKEQLDNGQQLPVKNGRSTRMQLLCTPIDMEVDTQNADAINLRKLTADEKFVTDNLGNEYRNANHPVSIPINGGQHVLVTYGYQPNNDTKTYAIVLDSNCNKLPVYDANGNQQKQVLVAANNNDDLAGAGDGAPAFIISDGGGTTSVGRSVLGNGNGDDDAWFLQMWAQEQGGGYKISSMKTRIDKYEERSRAVCQLKDNELDTVICVGTSGNTQPQNRGVFAVALDVSTKPQYLRSNNGTDDSRLLWHTYIAKRNEEGKGLYRVRGRMLYMGGDDFAINYSELQRPNNRNGKRKGKNNPFFKMAKLSRSGVQSLSQKMNARSVFTQVDTTHMSFVPVKIGEPGKERIASAAMTGTNIRSTTPAQVTFFEATPAGVTLVNTVGAGAPYDMHLYPNMYGNNPNTQGRNFTRGSVVTNPFYGTGSGRTLVKEFVAFAPSGKGEIDAVPKLSQYVTLIPTVVAPAPAPEPDAPAAGETPSEEPSTTPGTDSPSAPTTEAPAAGDAPAGSAGCSIAAGSSSNGPGSFLLLVGLAIAGLARRRQAR